MPFALPCTIVAPRLTPHRSPAAFARAALALVVMVLCTLAPSARAQDGIPQTIYVDDSAAPGGDGNSWTTAYNDLHLALDRVRAASDADGNIIRMAAGTYRPYEFGQASRIFCVPSNTTILGGFLPEFDNPRDPIGTPTIITGDIKGNDSDRTEDETVVDNAGTVIAALEASDLPGLTPTSDVVFDGLTIERGGYIQFSQTSVVYGGPGMVIRACLIRSNHGDCYLFGPALLEDTVFEDNYKIACIAKSLRNAANRPLGGTLRVERCVFRNNSRVIALDGADLYVDGLDVRAIDCTFEEDPAETIAHSHIDFRDPFPTATGAGYSHYFERCRFGPVRGLLFNQRTTNSGTQLVTLTDCFADDVNLLSVAAIHAVRSHFIDTLVGTRNPSRFEDCVFENGPRLGVAASANPNRPYPDTRLDRCTLDSCEATLSGV